jgi:TolB-like protein/Tfp pilus assembly protein PilF
MSLIAPDLGGFYEFGPFRLSPEQRLFERSGELVPLAPKVFDTLVELVEKRGQVVRKLELLKKIWPDSFVEEGSLAQNVSLLRRVLGETDDGQPYIQTVPKVGYRFSAHCAYRARVETHVPRREAISSIAVLPFANLSGDPNEDYFSDGLTEEIISTLAQIPGLKVTGRTSAFAFRDQKRDIDQIAAALHVTTILEGSVRKFGNLIRVTAQLISLNGHHLWSQRYNRSLGDILAIQEEIAGAIAAALQMKSIQRPNRRYEPDLRAYDLFFRGRHELSKLMPDSSYRARDFLERAIAIDHGYPEPHAELGQYYFLLGASSLRPVNETMPQARMHADKALALWPGSPRAHAVLCGVSSIYDNDWDESGRHYHLVFSGDSVPPEVRSRCAFNYLLPLGRFDEALIQFETALDEDPLSPASRGLFSWMLMCAGNADRAIAEAEKCLQINEGHWIPLAALSLALIESGDFSRARRVAERGLRASSGRPSHVGLLAAIYARLGEIGHEKLLAKLPPDGLFWYHLLCLDVEAAADDYTRMVEMHSPEATFFVAANFMKPLRSSSRWPAIARSMNLIAQEPAKNRHQ